LKMWQQNHKVSWSAPISSTKWQCACHRQIEYRVLIKANGIVVQSVRHQRKVTQFSVTFRDEEQLFERAWWARRSTFSTSAIDGESSTTRPPDLNQLFDSTKIRRDPQLRKTNHGVLLWSRF
jgi:hypothetical protein